MFFVAKPFQQSCLCIRRGSGETELNELGIHKTNDVNLFLLQNGNDKKGKMSRKESGLLGLTLDV